MKTIAVLLVISAVASGIQLTDFRTKWQFSSLDPNRTNSFFQLPLTCDDAISEGWVEQTGINSLDLTTYCYPNDGQSCLLYDSEGYIAGFMANILEADTEPAKDVYKWTDFDIYSSKMIFGNSYVTTTVYFVDPKYLSTGASIRSWDGYNHIDDLWVEKINGHSLVIPGDLSNLDPDWTQEACIPTMGTHYYYAMNTTTECKDFHPFFFMYNNGKLSGMGLQGFGICEVYLREWCESVDRYMLNTAIPTRPECLIEWLDEYNVISRHFFFTPEPWDITCS